MKDLIHAHLEKINKKFLKFAELHEEMAQICKDAAVTNNEKKLDVLAKRYAELFNAVSN